MSIFDEVEAEAEKLDRGIKAPAKAKAAPEPVRDPDEALAAEAGISVEALHAARAQQAAMWPESA